MTWRSSRNAAGFTLIEVIVVLVVLALVATIFVGRGPIAQPRGGGRRRRPPAGRRHAAGALRGDRDLTGRSASASTRRVTCMPAAARSHVLPGEIGLAVQGPDGAAARALAILFRPDGSSSGGSVALADGARTLHVSVDWVTGRVVLVQ